MVATAPSARPPEKVPSEARSREWVARWVPLAALLTLVMFAWLGWHAYSTFAIGQTVKTAYVRSEQQRDLICELEQKLLVAAVMAVGALDPDWRARYRALEQRLSGAIDQALNRDDPGYNAAALGTIAASHNRLRTLEARALGLADQGRHHEGLQLLAGAEYQGETQIFTAATQTFIESYRDHLDHRLRFEATRELWSLGFTFVIFAIPMAVWLLLAARLEHWRRALDREVNERIRAEEQLLQAQKMEAVGQLASGVAHDFNNLLTAINGYLSLARDKLPDGHAVREDLTKLASAADEASGVTRSLLTFSRSSETEKQPIALGPLLDEVEGLLKGMLPASIDLAIGGNQELWVDGDRNQLVQALLNLAINARDAMPDGGRLQILLDILPEADSLDAPLGLARLRVIDNGQGMTPELRARAFEPFYTTKPRGQGTGLGLAVVHGIVKAHGGRVGIDPAGERGTAVTVLLPLIPAPPEPVRRGPDDEVAAVKNAARIVVAEDHRYVREILVTTLRSAGHEVIAAADGPELLAAFDQDTHPDLALIDLDLPSKSGLDCLMELRERGVDVPAMIITGHLEPDLEERLHGEALVLMKPFQMTDLIRIVEHMLKEEVHR